MRKTIIALLALACLGAIKLRSPKDTSQPAKTASTSTVLPPLPSFVTKNPQDAPWIMLAWNPSPSTNIVGYNIYYGIHSGVYTNVLPCGNVTNAVVTNLWAGRTYYFAATTLNDIGLESEYSQEISYTVPGGVVPPTNYTVSVSIQQSQDLTNWLTATNLPVLSFTNASGSNLYWRAVMQIQTQP